MDHTFWMREGNIYGGRNFPTLTKNSELAYPVTGHVISDLFEAMTDYGGEARDSRYHSGYKVKLVFLATDSYELIDDVGLKRHTFPL